jgi:hypothetical protein
MIRVARVFRDDDARRIVTGWARCTMLTRRDRAGALDCVANGRLSHAARPKLSDAVPSRPDFSHNRLTANDIFL